MDWVGVEPELRPGKRVAAASGQARATTMKKDGGGVGVAAKVNRGGVVLVAVQATPTCRILAREMRGSLPEQRLEPAGDTAGGHLLEEESMASSLRVAHTHT